MPVEVILPRVDMDMAEAKISRWHVSDGAQVAKGQTVFEIETDKAAMEIEAPASGILRGISAPEGTVVAVGVPVAWIYAEGEAVADKVKPAATPRARVLARERGVDLSGLQGSGPRGRIQAADIGGEASGLPLRSAKAERGRPEASPPAAARLHTVQRGDVTAPPVVFIHGFGSDLTIWKSTLSQLDPATPTVQIDLPAHGKSALGGVQSFADIVEAVAQTLDGLGLNGCHLAGHSFGGMIALALAKRKRVALRSLMMISPAGLGPDIEREFLEGFSRATRVESLTPWLRLLFAKPALVTPAFAKAIMQSRDDETQREQQRQIADTMFPDGTQANDLRDALEDLAMPCKILWGRQDRIIPVTHATNLPGHIGLHLMADTGHVPHLEQPALVARLIGELIRSAG